MIAEFFLIECRHDTGNTNLYWTGKQWVRNPVHGERYATRKDANIALGKVCKPDVYETITQDGDCLCVTPVKIY